MTGWRLSTVGGRGVTITMDCYYGGPYCLGEVLGNVGVGVGYQFTMDCYQNGP